jgi:hypothetical protein
MRSFSLSPPVAAPRPRPEVRGPDALTRVITRSSWDRRESVLVEAYEAELVVLRRWDEFTVRRAPSRMLG